MKLFVCVGNKVIDSVSVDPKRLKDQNYLHALRGLLYVKNEPSILALQREPNYYLEVASCFDEQVE